MSHPSAKAQSAGEIVLYRVNAGGGVAGDWEEDSNTSPSPYLLPGSGSFYTNALSPGITPSVPEGTPDAIFNDLRLDANKVDPPLEWDFPVTPGESLIVRLYFVEWTRCSVGELIFDIEIEGEIVWDNFDIYNQSNNICKQGIMRSFEVTPLDDTLDINLPLENGKPASIAGIEILVAGEPESPMVTRVAGNLSPGYSGDGGPATQAQLDYPRGMAFDADGNMYIASTDNHGIRKVEAETGIISTVVGTGVAGFSGDGGDASLAQLSNPWDVVIGPDGHLYIADAGNQRIRKVDLETNTITTVAGNGGFGFGGDGGLATNATMYGPKSIALDTAGNLYITDTNNYRIRKVDVSTGIINTIAGNGSTGVTGDGGQAINAAIDAPGSIVLDNNNHIFFVSVQANRIRRIDAGTGVITTVAGDGSQSTGGDGGPAINAQINFPFAVALDVDGVMYIAEYGGQNIRRVDSVTGIITTVEHTASSTHWPLGVDTNGKNVYFSNQGNNSVFEIKYPEESGATSLVVDPLVIEFEDVPSGEQSAPRTITLTNEGDFPLDVTSVVMGGTDAVDFKHDFSGHLTIPAHSSSSFAATFAPDPISLPPPPPFNAGDVLFRVNAGGELVGDWEPDTDAAASPYLIPGTASVETTAAGQALDASVPEGTPPELFMSKRLDANQPDPTMQWAFPVSAGEDYEVRLYFAELSRCSVNNRVFNVEIEGTVVLENVDVYSEAGEACNVGIMRMATVTADDDMLDISFPLVNFKPSILSGIEILSSASQPTIQRSAQLLISHTGVNGPHEVMLSGGEITEGTENQSPVASFASTVEGLTVQFTDGSSDPDGSITAWAWDFGDGNQSTVQSPEHTYTAGGVYTISLTVTDNQGATDTVNSEVTVAQPEGIVVSLPEAVMDIGSPEYLAVSVTGIESESIQSYMFSMTYDPAVFLITGAEVAGTLSESAPAFVNTTVPGEFVISWASIESLAGNGTLVYLEVDLIAEGVSPLTFTALSLNEGTPSAVPENGSLEVVTAGGDGPFQETGGLVVIEAEHFHGNVARNAHAWENSEAVTGFSGSSSMSADPNNGTSYKKAEVSSSPEMQYQVDFATTGSYFVWARVFAPGSSDNTLHMGLDGVVSASKMEAGEEGAWTWTNLNTKGNEVTMGVTATGVQTIHVWMYEDGISVDKLLLTTDPAYEPEGLGPTESPRSSAPEIMNRSSDAYTTALKTLEVVPTEFALGQNYPNPFNPTTTLSYDIPEAAYVRLEVYDMMGRRIATLVDGQHAAGRYETQWNAVTDSGNAVASGIYIYRLQADSFESVGRMVLTR